jgi:hexosaminidase
MPEFDMPGHTTAWMPGAPEIASAPGPYEIEKRFGVFGATMNPSSEKTYKFLDKFFKEMAALFPDEYMHIGGDENNGEQWNANPAIQKFMKEKGIKDNHQLQAHFNKRLLKILQKHKKKMMGWDEIFQPDLPQSIVIHSWRGRQYMDEAAQKGYQSVLSNGYYIDLSFNARKHYMVDPLPDTTHLTAEQQKRILGGEAPMWAELVTLENVESRIWPRTAAIAERLWSPNPAAPIDDMYRRLMLVSQRLEETGSRHMANREPMMRRLAGTSNIQPLMLLANAAEPIEGYKRHGSQKYTTFHPLSRFVDVTMPDAPDAIEFSLLLNRFIESKSSDTYVELSKMLTRWEMNHQQFAVIAKENPLLTEVEPLSINLAMLAATTNVMLKQLYYGKMLTKDDAAKMERVIIELAKPVAEMNLPLANDAKRILELVTDSTNTLPSTEE